MPAPVISQEAGKQSLDRLWRRAHPDNPCPPTFERARPFAERLGVRQQAAGVSEQILTFGRELHAAPETVEQLHPQLCLERTNLPGQRWLTEVQPGDSAPEAASVDDTYERAEVS